MRTVILFALAFAAPAAGCAAATPAPAGAQEERVCTEIVITGSLIPQEVCETRAEAAAQDRKRAGDQREIERIQRNGAMKR
jgi:ABC-type sugar transport system substrate-binding protein